MYHVHSPGLDIWTDDWVPDVDGGGSGMRRIFKIFIETVSVLLVITAMAMPVQAARRSNRCRYEYCHEEADYGSDYCKSHKCHIDWGCTAGVYTDSTHHTSKYCKRHTCSRSGCYRPVAGKSKYCCRLHREYESEESPICKRLGCSNNKVSGGSYCSAHTCIITECNRYAVMDGYCDNHCKTYSKTYKELYSKKGKSNKDSDSNENTVSDKTSGAVKAGSTVKSSSSSDKSSSKKKSSNYDDYYEDDPEAYYEDNKDLYGSFDEAMDDWADEYGDDY